MAVIRCEAPHPKRPNKRCGYFLGRLPFQVTFTRIVRRSNMASPETIVLQCRSCGSNNVFETNVTSEAA